VSKENEGSIFTFTLPYTAGKKEFISDVRIIKPRNFTRLKRASILLVEDNDINRLYASSILKMWGCHFETAENGVVALEKIRNNAFDAILMDIQMPVMDGFETTKAIRKGDPNKSQVPIIALTANATQKDFEKCLAAGMNDCITKPFTQEDLLKTLTKYLGARLKKKNQPSQGGKQNNTEFDLSYLIKASDNNQEFIQEIINTFLDSMPKTIEEIQTQLQLKNWEHLAKVVHKIKPSITLMGIHHLKDRIALLEHETRTNLDEKTINGLATEISQSLLKVIRSLKAYA
jgi:CheY-like chemotaxis protein/HPt (histidine-containing phosphotransfer) domain-containing protein